MKQTFKVPLRELFNYNDNRFIVVLSIQRWVWDFANNLGYFSFRRDVQCSRSKLIFSITLHSEIVGTSCRLCCNISVRSMPHVNVIFQRQCEKKLGDMLIGISKLRQRSERCDSSISTFNVEILIGISEFTVNNRILLKYKIEISWNWILLITWAT